MTCQPIARTQPCRCGPRIRACSWISATTAWPSARTAAPNTASSRAPFCRTTKRGAAGGERMKKGKQLNGSAAEVEAAFYEALNRADVEALMALWADDEEIVCIHPGGPRLHGHAAIQASWQAIFERGGLQIRPSQLHETHNLMSSVHTVIEGVTASAG